MVTEFSGYTEKEINYGKGLITAECSFKNRMPVLFDYTVTRCMVALRNRMEAFGEYQHFFCDRAVLFERVVSLGIVFFTYTFNFYCSQ